MGATTSFVARRTVAFGRVTRRAPRYSAITEITSINCYTECDICIINI